jgi:hypothetical protein
MSSIGLGTNKRWNLLASVASSIAPLCEPACSCICIWDGWMDEWMEHWLIAGWMDCLLQKGKGIVARHSAMVGRH